MTDINDKLLTKLENLSMLEIDKEKREEFLNSLREIVEFVENLNELDLDGEEASFTVLEGGTPFRADEPKRDPEVIEEILKNAPKAEDNFFVVPKIIQ
ncbi:MAG: Asp-tRNA(Asn)/Glu-tRNA(Gln) amidotransferase subunit GatC [Epsilonproteobacteria bacterium]|nr:Asp-tRNA(Asn)/Glu-tRNA(Gln) amidotransferase subunit GatC [Campylobacterota bacterium]